MGRRRSLGGAGLALRAFAISAIVLSLVWVWLARVEGPRGLTPSGRTSDHSSLDPLTGGAASEGDVRSDLPSTSLSFHRATADISGDGIHSPSITGIVLGPRGAPVVNAVVIAIEAAVLPGGPFDEEYTTVAFTDEIGAFTLECAAVGSHQVNVAAAGMADELLSDCRAGDHLEIFLCRGASISGRVCSPDDGDAAGGIEVRAGDRKTIANAAGVFQIDGLTPGTVFLSTESNWDGWAGAFESVELVEGDHLWVDLELRPGVSVVGRVVDRRDYSPIEGVKIALDDGRALAVTDERGRYRIEGYSRIVDLSDPLSASAPGFACVTAYCRRRRRANDAGRGCPRTHLRPPRGGTRRRSRSPRTPCRRRGNHLIGADPRHSLGLERTLK